MITKYIWILHKFPSLGIWRRYLEEVFGGSIWRKYLEEVFGRGENMNLYFIGLNNHECLYVRPLSFFTRGIKLIYFIPLEKNDIQLK